jgi:hypothetical protein
VIVHINVTLISAVSAALTSTAPAKHGSHAANAAALGATSDQSRGSASIANANIGSMRRNTGAVRHAIERANHAP